jgi:hypothetical protein
MTIKHEFVEFIPDKLQTDTLYISVSHRTAIHKCLCGCGVEVVTPISPIDWRITFDGETVSLFPSIGNWSYPCRSHYWIKKGKVLWAEDWSQEEIREARAHDKIRKQDYYSELKNEQRSRQTESTLRVRPPEHALKRLWNWIKPR